MTIGILPRPASPPPDKRCGQCMYAREGSNSSLNIIECLHPLRQVFCDRSGDGPPTAAVQHFKHKWCLLWKAKP